VVAEWQFDPVLSFADTVPNVAFSRSVARLSAGVWLFTSNHTTVVRRAGGPDILVPIEEPWGFHLSAAADRAILNSVLTADGTPVLQMSTGDTLFRLPPITLSGAAFNAGGSMLFALGDDGTGGERLWAFDAATGAVRDSEPIPAGFTGSGVALSDYGHAFVGAMADSVPHVIVFATAGDTLSFQGIMGAPASSACSSCGSNLLFQAAILADNVTPTLFLVSQGEPALIWEFDLLPVLTVPASRRR
jgi:outer membrane protein assembly factor BamB